MKSFRNFLFIFSLIVFGMIGLHTTDAKAATPHIQQVKTVKNAKCMFLKKLKNYYDNYKKAPDVTYSYYNHGPVIQINLLQIEYTPKKYAQKYEIMISKDEKFTDTHVYTTTNKNYFYLGKDPSGFITPSDHGKYMKIRAIYKYRLHTNWSKVYPIGCGKLHLKK